jgi:hypothetical protein
MMPDKPPKLPALGFAGFAAIDPISTGRRKPRWSINPLRTEAMASAEGGRFSHLEGELLQGIGRRKPE